MTFLRYRHGEERRDEASQGIARDLLDCFVGCAPSQ